MGRVILGLDSPRVAWFTRTNTDEGNTVELTEEQFIAECLKDLADLHRADGRTAREFLNMLHPLERRDIARRLEELNKLTITKRGWFRKSYDWK